MEKIVRITTVTEQDETRRADIARMTPNERVALLMRMRDDFFGEACCPIAKVAHIRWIAGNEAEGLERH